jgi:hypothetical protein
MSAGLIFCLVCVTVYVFTRDTERDGDKDTYVKTYLTIDLPVELSQAGHAGTEGRRRRRRCHCRSCGHAPACMPRRCACRNTHPLPQHTHFKFWCANRAPLQPSYAFAPLQLSHALGYLHITALVYTRLPSLSRHTLTKTCIASLALAFAQRLSSDTLISSPRDLGVAYARFRTLHLLYAHSSKCTCPRERLRTRERLLMRDTA